MKPILFTLLFISILNGQLFSQGITRIDGSKITTKEIDQKVMQLMTDAKVAGLSIAVFNKNRLSYIKSYGYKNKPQNSLLDTATIVYGASLSKAVFGYLIMKLVEKNVIDLDKPLYKYLSKPIAEYEYFSDMKEDERWKQITARMCLSHTTGLPNVRWFHPITGEQDTLGIMKLYFKPGSQYAYSGEGFKLLQLVIEEITHNTTEDLAQELVFQPLAMKRTGYIWHDRFGDDNVAVGHLENGQIDQKRKRTEAVAGGSLVTSIADYSRFISAVLQQKGLTAGSYKEMLSAQIAIHSKTQFPPVSFETTTENDAIKLSYGLGWGVFKCKFGRAFFKEGNGGSWRNYNINFPDQGKSLIILSNSENAEKIFKALVETCIGETCIPWKWEGYLTNAVN